VNDRKCISDRNGSYMSSKSMSLLAQMSRHRFFSPIRHKHSVTESSCEKAVLDNYMSMYTVQAICLFVSI